MYALQVARGDFETARSTLGEAVERNGETRLSEWTKMNWHALAFFEVYARYH